MRRARLPFKRRCVSIMLAGLALCGYGATAFAWSADGHTAIGMVATGRMQGDTFKQLESIVGTLDAQAIAEACNWPDAIRDEADWEWSKLQHYVNIPRGDFGYLESRDCPDQLCATQAIKRYAGELADIQLPREQRWQAFAWLCHITADLHQPMHAGFEDDRGGNEVEVTTRDETMNLHYFWDHELIGQYAGDSQGLYWLLQSSEQAVTAGWGADDVNGWTDESHELAAEKAYPPTRTIGESWERQSWAIARERINLAATRLALIIETTLVD